MISEDVSISWKGISGEVSGTIKYVPDFESLFGETEKNGHFFPVKFDDKYKGKSVELSGRSNENRTVTIDDDLLLVQRIENLSEEKILIAKVDGKEIFTLDFSKVTETPAVTVLPQEHNLGKYEKYVKDLVDPDVEISATGEVTGKLKKVTDFEKFSSDVSKQSGHYLPVRVDSQYMGKDISVTGTRTTSVKVDEESDLDFILRVASNSTTFKFSEGKNTFMTLTFKNATIE